ncbi:MAG: glutathione S-transferase N-terminal domain-containing protein [Parvularculales bacterium]
MSTSDAPPGIMRVYGCKISYYTGKLETYLRYRSIPYESLQTVGNEKKLIAGAGVVQMPVVQLTDGRWMTDTTPMIAWLESQQDAPHIYPVDSALNFIALLIEDYADEWLWRPAMHYRWSYGADRRYAAEALYNELIAGTLPIPKFIALRLLKRRQLGGFVRRDGVNVKTRFHVDRTYLTVLDRMQTIFEHRPFMLGQAPTIADMGMMGPMLRHFGQDPTPAEIMRNRAPAVYEWVARMWNTKSSSDGNPLISNADDGLEDFLDEVCETHLAQLRQNAEAFRGGNKRYDQIIQDCHYTNVPTSRYRVWCLEVLRRAWANLQPDMQKRVRAHMKSPAADILWDDTELAPSNYDSERKAPFNKGINVFGKGVPPR